MVFIKMSFIFLFVFITEGLKFTADIVQNVILAQTLKKIVVYTKNQ